MVRVERADVERRAAIERQDGQHRRHRVVDVDDVEALAFEQLVEPSWQMRRVGDARHATVVRKPHVARQPVRVGFELRIGRRPAVDPVAGW
jgi:hypothetical protein